jgi:hypothetical protein
VSVTITTELGEQGSAIDCEVEVPGCLMYPAAVWEFDDEDETDSVGNYPLTLTSVSFGPGIIGSAAGFGSGSLAEVSGSSDAQSVFTRQPGTSFTIALWFQLPGTAYADVGGGVAACNGETPVNKGQVIFSHSDFEYVLMFYQPAGGAIDDLRLVWLLSDGSDVGTGVGVVYLGKPTVSTWHFVVVGYDDSVPTPFGKIDNGTLQTYAPFGHLAALTKSKSLRIGASAAAAGDHHFTGSLDGIGFWKCVLSESEMTTLYNSGTGRLYPFTS